MKLLNTLKNISTLKLQLQIIKELQMEKVEFLVPNTFIRYNLEDIDEGIAI